MRGGNPRPRTLLALIAGAVLGFGGALTGGVLADRPSEAALPAHPARPVGGSASSATTWTTSTITP
jgi:hypothetical protein